MKNEEQFEKINSQTENQDKAEEREYTESRNVWYQDESSFERGEDMKKEDNHLYNAEETQHSTYSQDNQENYFRHTDISQTPPPKPQKPVKERKKINKEKTKKFLRIGGAVIAGCMLLFTTITSAYLLNENIKDKHTVAQVEQSAGSSDVTQTADSTGELSISEISEMVSPSVVLITGTAATGSGQGSGFIISEDGYIATNAHVVSGFDTLTVTLNNDSNTEYPATVVGYDEVTDIAVIKIQASGLSAVTLGKSSELKVGEDVVVIGNPLGEEFAGSVTTGIISALEREVTMDENSVYTYIQTDAAINEGNSGGPLVNMQGQVIGVNAAKISTSVAEGMGFAIPIDDAVPVMNDLMQYGYVKNRSYIGISVGSVSEEASQYYNVPVGVQITAIEEGSPAEEAGLCRGDIITAINDTEITTVGKLNKVKYEYSPGDTIKLTVYRYQSGETETVKLTLDEMPRDTQ